MASSRRISRSRLPDDELVKRIMEHASELLRDADSKEREEIGKRCIFALQGARWAYWFLRGRRLLPVAALGTVLGGVLIAVPIPTVAALGGGLLALSLIYALTIWACLAQWHSCERCSKIFVATSDILRYDSRHRRRLENELKDMGERLLAP